MIRWVAYTQVSHIWIGFLSRLQICQAFISLTVYAGDILDTNSNLRGMKYENSSQGPYLTFLYFIA